MCGHALLKLAHWIPGAVRSEALQITSLQNKVLKNKTISFSWTDL